MTSLKNALEEIVVVEVQEQLKLLNKASRETINLSEVTAFALNRLPALYASTSRGWLQQRKRAHNELRNQVVIAVRHALLGVKLDPLRKDTQFTTIKVETPAHVLAKLQKLFSKPSLAWQDVPEAFQETLNLVTHSAEYTGLSIYDRTRIREIKSYLQRKENHHDHDNWHQQNTEIPNPELDSYIISASYVLTNVLEDIVQQEVKKQLAHMANVLPRKVRIDDVSAYVLNRLPPMYATTEQGIAWQTQKSKEQIASQIESTVIQSIMALSKMPRRLADPLPLLKFKEDCEQAIKELRLIFQRDDITWHNIANLAEYAITHERQGMTYWRQQWRMLGQIYSEMYLNPGDAELSLNQTPEGEILIIQTRTREAFGWFADNPKDIGISTLRLFPAVSEIELHASFLDFTVNYTREEMAADGII
ncbi:MAG: late competence development ComFB family protein [Pseudanabaena sp.]